MKVLYAIQGTGNGHLSRARHVIPILLKKNIQLDLLVSGTQADVVLPYPIKYQFKGLSFIFGKKGGVDVWKTYLRANTARLRKEILSIPIHEYNLVINDFEPVSAWACRGTSIPCISFSHQAAVLTPKAPKPRKKDHFGKFILRYYAPTKKQYGLHFRVYDGFTFTPIIRQAIRDVKGMPVKNHYTVYLPSYEDEKIIKILSKIPQVSWQVFSKHNTNELIIQNVFIRPIKDKEFVYSMATSQGVLCGAGFETPAEALYLEKKLMVIPMKGQYEQQCNAAALKRMGIPVLKSLKKKHITKIEKWIEKDQKIPVHYPEITEKIIDLLLTESKVPSLK